MRSHSREIAVISMVAVAIVSAASLPFISDSASSDESQSYVSHGLLTRFVDNEGVVYSMEGGSFRADMLDLSKLTALGGPMVGNSESGLLVADETFAIYGIDEGQWVAGRSLREYGSHGAAQACWNDEFVLTFTAVGVEPYPAPLSRSTPVPDASSGSPTPTPTPSPKPHANSGKPIEMTEAGLIAAGWPHMDWGQGPLIFEGKRYRSTGGWHLDDGEIAAIFPGAPLVEDSVIAVDLAVQPELPAGLGDLLASTAVTDHVRVYRPAEGPEREDVIIVDPCPRDLRPDSYVFFKPVDARN